MTIRIQHAYPAERFFRQTGLLAAVALFLTGCMSDTPKPDAPPLKASLMTEGSSKTGISFARVTNIANNAGTMSCGELALGSVYATALKSIANPKVASADALTRAAALKVGQDAGQKIEKEMQCHCHEGLATRGFEIYERRLHLQKTRTNRRLNPALARFYPSNSAGQPRFLEPGEPISRAVLAQLPPPAAVKRKSDCGRKCKAARARTNAAAVAAGKPEPWPNLQRPRPNICRN